MKRVDPFILGVLVGMFVTAIVLIFAYEVIQ